VVLAPVRLATAPEPLQAAQLRVLLWKVVLAAILSIRRIARSQRLMATKGGPEENGGTTTKVVGARGTGRETTKSGKIVVDIVKAETTTTRVTTLADRMKIAEAGTITTKVVGMTTMRIVAGAITTKTATKSMIAQGGRIGMIEMIKTTSGMVGRAGVADVDCLAKVRWLTSPAVPEKNSFSQTRSFSLSSPFRIDRRSGLRVRSRSVLLSFGLSMVQDLRLGASSGGRFALLLRGFLARVTSSYLVFVVFGV